MTICCFPNCAYLSETSRMAAVYKELIKQGEKPLMATHGGTYEFILKDENIPYHIIEPYVSHERSLEYAAASRSENGTAGFGIYKSSNELKDHVEKEVKFFQDNDITLVVTGWTLSCAISTRAAQIPLAETHLASFVPPALGKIGIPFLEPYDKYIYKIIPDSLIGAVYHWGMRLDMFMDLFNTAALECNVRPFTGFMDLMMADLTLVTDTPEILGIPEKQLEKWKPVNPRLYSRTPKIFYTGALYAELFGKLPEEVTAFLTTEKPKLYIALTSSKLEYIEALYSLVKEMDVKALFITTVHEGNLKETSDIMIRSHLPSHLVMPLVDCAIIHGGQGSTQTAIASAAPVIGFPFHGEQSMNLKLIQDAGGGFCLPLRYMKRRNTIKKYIQKIIKDKKYKKNMLKLKSFQDKYNGAERSAEIIINYLNGQ